MKIKINENKLYNIIVEKVKNILRENISSRVYHFTSFNSMYKIAVEDRFILSSSYAHSSDDMDNKRHFFISLTRQKDARLGYSDGHDVRITFNGDKLNERFKGKAIDYWGKNLGLHSYYNGVRGEKNISPTQRSTENEDRLFHTDPVIENIHQYIDRIDILLDVVNEKTLGYSKYMKMTKCGRVMFFYDNEKDFNYQTKNTINDKIERADYDIRVEHDGYTNLPYKLSMLMQFFLSCDKNINDIYSQKECASFIGGLLKKYGFEKYISAVLKDVNVYDIGTNRVKEFNPNDIISEINKEDYIKINIMMRDWLHSNKFKNFREAKVSYINSVNQPQYDYNKQIIALVFNDENGGRKIIPNPETISFWKKFPNVKHWFVDDIYNNIKSHKSKTDEKFKFYLQRLTRKNISISNMVEILNKLNIDNNVLLELIGGTFTYEKIGYDDIRNFDNYMYDYDEIINLFKQN